MSILSDIEIKELCENTNTPMISPFVAQQVREIDGKKIISYGNSSYGYDIRLAPEFKIFSNISSTIIDPLDFDHDSYVDRVGEYVIIPPHSFVLGRSVEKFNIPRDIQTIVLNKSTYARCGINCLASPLESEWCGYVTLEFSNGSPLPAKLYANQGCAQILFFKGKIPCEVSYADRKGKYQNQESTIVLPKV